MGSWLVILSALGFASLGIFGKFAYQVGFTRNQALTWRFGLSLPLIFLFLYFTKSLPKLKDSIGRRNFLLAIALGFVGIGVEATLYFMTIERLGVAMTGIFLYLYPAFVALLTYFFLSEKLSLGKWFCVLLSLIGCFFTCYFSAGFEAMRAAGTAGNFANLFDVGVGVAMAVWYAIYLLVGNRLIKSENPLTISFGVVLGAFLSFVLLCGVDALHFVEPTLEDVLTNSSQAVVIPPIEMWKWPMSLNQWAPLFGLAIIASFMAFTSLYAGLKKVGPTKASVLSTLEMVFTVVFAAMFLGEKLTLWQGFGGALILVSVLLIQKVR